MADFKEIRECLLSELERSSDEVKRVQLFWCDKFLSFAPKNLSEWDKRVAISFLDQLEKEGYAPTTRRRAFGVVKRVFDAARTVHEQERTRLLFSVDLSSIDENDPAAMVKVLKGLGDMQKAAQLPGPRWDVGKRVMPRVQAEEMERPALEFGEIERLVSLTRGNGLAAAEVAYLGLGSVYFLRAGELRRVRREHIDFNEGTIWIDTEKDGEKRKQLLSPVLIPYLERYDFSVEYSPFMMWKMFKEMCEKAGLERKPHEGWHAFRRYGDTALRDALATDPSVKRDAQLITKIFLRWRLVSSSEMTDRYYTANPLEADRIVLEHHPVVPLWR